MRRLSARQDDRVYPIYVGEALERVVAQHLQSADQILLVSCARVLGTPVGKRFERAIRDARPKVQRHLLPDGEAGKKLAVIERIAEKALKAGATRSSLVFALGGGAVTDAAGFLASVYMRGIPWVAAPTTLLGMLDAAIGGKTAVNLRIAKNAIGAFYPPHGVFADVGAIDSLSARELRSGWGEALKYACLEPALLPKAAALARGGRIDEAFVARCMELKVGVVERDPRERGERKLLNLGHTFGHAVEAAGGFKRYTHGEAVAVGLAFAFRLAAQLERIDAGAVAMVERAIRTAGLPIRVPRSVVARARALLGYDKKRAPDGLRWVLPRREGASWKVEWDVEGAGLALETALREIGERS